MDAGLTWTVVGSLAGVAAVGIGVAQLRQSRKDRGLTPEPAAPGGLAPGGLAGNGAVAVPVSVPAARAPELELPLVAPAAEHAPLVVGEVPQQPVGYQARADLLAALDAGPGSRVVAIAVTGMRGVGKTHLAAAYARARIAEHGRLVAWVNAEDLGGLLTGLTAIATALGTGAGLDAEAAGRAVRHRLETEGERCLLVFDNATDPDLIQPYLPAAGPAMVIITSNEQSIADLGTPVDVTVFTEDEALAFLAERTRSADEAGARELAAELGWLPLALAQAAAVIAAQHLDYATYLSRLRDLPLAELLPPAPAGQYPRGTAAAILLALDSVTAADRTGACAPIMDLLAVLSPSGIPRSLVHAAARGFSADVAEEITVASADEALGRLAGASLLTFSVDGATVSAHRLVTRVIRDHLTATDRLTVVCRLAAVLLDAGATELDSTWHQHRPAVRDLIDQITALHQHAATCRDDTLDSEILRLRLCAVYLLNELGDSTAQAILVGELLLADQERTLGTDHPDTLSSRNNLASAYQDAGRTSEAITLHQHTHTAYERTLGTDHPHTLNSRNNLALAYQDAGRTSDAITLHQHTLAARERTLGTDHPDTHASRNNLASAYQEAARTSEAITLHQHTLTAYERTLGTDHPHTLNSRNNLALAYQDAGRTSDAITLHQHTLAARERTLGTDHPDTHASRNNLALAYQEAARTSEAITLHQHTLTAYERTLGTDHPHTLNSRNNLALAYQDAGRTSDAITLHEQTLTAYERALGTDHPHTLTSRNNLANAYRDAGRADEADALLQRDGRGEPPPEAGGGG